MTKSEMTKIFTLMALNYRNAKMFEGGIAALKPTIELWTSCLADVDFWTGQQALLRVLREYKFPPTIAEFKEQADSVLKSLEGKDFVVDDIKKSTRKKQPAPPFTTSTLQQEANRKLGFNSRRTMKAAQELY